MIADHLHIQPGQKVLTTAQQAELGRFTEEWVQAQLAAGPVNKQEVSAWLGKAYQAAGLVPPRKMRWFESPRQMVAQRLTLSPPDLMLATNGIESWYGQGYSREDYERYPSATNTMHLDHDIHKDVVDAMRGGLAGRVWLAVRWSVYRMLQESLHPQVFDRVSKVVEVSVRAYDESAKLGYHRFFDRYYAPNELQAMAHFNTLVSGYWLQADQALLVQRPRVLCQDAAGRLHSETGKCIEYPDGWGWYAWHGLRVPEQVILRPEQLTRKDFLNEQNVEVRRVIQERMGERFVSELGGIVLDSSPRGTLYEARLPADDPERVARYVQVQDASTERRYLLRVPPTIQTAAEAVAWTFQLPEEGYGPARET